MGYNSLSRQWYWTTAIWVCLICATQTSLAANPSSKYALIIGVDTYEQGELEEMQRGFAVSDARSLAELLHWAGYTVDVLLDEHATQAAIRKKLAELPQQAFPEGIVFVGIFGHGVDLNPEDRRRATAANTWLCPYDASVRTPKAILGAPIPRERGRELFELDPGSLVSFAEILNAVRSATAAKRFIVADCHHNPPVGPQGPTFGANFKIEDLPSNTVMLLSCQPNEPVYDHADSEHSAFGKCLLHEMQDLYASGKLSSGALADRMRREVPRLVAIKSDGKHQTPRLLANGSFDLQFTRLMGRQQFNGRKAGEDRDLVPGIKFHWCPNGHFAMGSPRHEEERLRNEEQTEVSLTGFWIGETEITQYQWESLMKSRPWQGKTNMMAERLHLTLAIREGTDYAASYISQGGNVDGTIEPDSALEFCRRLTTRERKAGRLPTGWKYMLPTEAQWEYACRAGSITKFSFGDDDAHLKDYAWWGGKYGAGTARPSPYPNVVATRLPNAWGLYDMHGNVWEWCADWYVDRLPGGRDPMVTTTGSLRVCKGGAWLLNAASCRSAIRSGGSPDNRNSCTGFRLVAVQSND